MDRSRVLEGVWIHLQEVGRILQICQSGVVFWFFFRFLVQQPVGQL